jgi:hypothetical protein
MRWLRDNEGLGLIASPIVKEFDLVGFNVGTDKLVRVGTYHCNPVYTSERFRSLEYEIEEHETRMKLLEERGG